MTTPDSTNVALNLNAYLTDFKFWITIYTIIISIIGAIKLTKKQILLWQTRKLRKIWGIKDKENVIVVCSELDDQEIRQNVEPREYIYNLKYGDIDAYFEVIVTLLRLYPRLKIRILSSGEAERIKLDLYQTCILIGGPDYNVTTERILAKQITQFYYRSPYLKESSKHNPDEIVIYNKRSNVEFHEKDSFKDYGYFERINNPSNPSKKIILIGGCHTIGVTAAIKSFSLFNSEYDDLHPVVIDNSKLVARKIKKSTEFAIVVAAEQVGQSISTPRVVEDLIYIKDIENNKS